MNTEFRLTARRRVVRWSLVVAVLCLAGPASAVSVNLRYHGYTGSNRMYIEGDSTRFAGGILKISSQSEVLLGEELAFCVEPGQFVETGQYDLVTDIDDIIGHQTLDSHGQPLTFTAEKVRLLSAWYGQQFKGRARKDWDKTEGVAFQWGVWKILNEPVLSLDDLPTNVLDTGSWQINRSRSDRLAQDAADRANEWFAMLDPDGPMAGLGILVSADKQDLALFAGLSDEDFGDDIPEPATCAALSAGLLALWRYRRNR